MQRNPKSFKHLRNSGDSKGHQGKIVVNTGALIWLNGLYGVNLRTNDANTGFNTDLHTIAENIMDLHDQNYKQQ
jgi:hypothetical protein